MGADLGGIEKKIDGFLTEGDGMTVAVKAQVQGDQLEITGGAGQGKANVVMVYFDREKIIDVEKGENGGQKIAYMHSVSDVETVGMWDGKQTRLTLPATLLQKPDLEGCAVLLQSSTGDGTPAAILGATVVMAGKNI
jgi:hypothetical protein